MTTHVTKCNASNNPNSNLRYLTRTILRDTQYETPGYERSGWNPITHLAGF